MGAGRTIVEALTRVPYFGCIALFFVLGVLLSLLGLVFGFTLDDVDLWWEAQAGWFDIVLDIGWRIACGIVVLICAAMIAMAVGDKVRRRSWRKQGDAPGFGCALVALLVGYMFLQGVIYGAE